MKRSILDNWSSVLADLHLRKVARGQTATNFGAFDEDQYATMSSVPFCNEMLCELIDASRLPCRGPAAAYEKPDPAH